MSNLPSKEALDAALSALIEQRTQPWPEDSPLSEEEAKETTRKVLEKALIAAYEVDNVHKIS